MKLLKRLFNKYIQKQKAVYVDSDSAYSVTMLQLLEPRKMFDAALGVEIANLFTQQAAVQGQEADFLAADTGDNTQANQAVDAFITDSTLDPNIITNLNDDAANLPIDSINLDNYYSFDKSLVKELVFVDSGIDNYAELLEGVDLDKLISGQMEVVVIDSKYSGIEQIGDYLNQYDHQLDAVHIVSHGDVAELKLGSDVLNNASLGNFNSSLASWGASFAVGADLLFYGCNVAEGVAGQKFVQDLHDIIETDIAASSDLTGHVDLGGDWELEVTQGEITAKLAFTGDVVSNYWGALATYNVTNTSNSGAGSLRQAITDANSNPGDDIININVAGTISLLTSLPNITGKVTIQNGSNGYIAPDTPIDPAIPASSDLVGSTAGIYNGGLPISPIDPNPNIAPYTVNAVYGSTVVASNFRVTINISSMASGSAISFASGSEGSVLDGLRFTTNTAKTSFVVFFSTNDLTISNNYFDSNNTTTRALFSNGADNFLVYNNVVTGGTGSAVDFSFINNYRFEHNSFINNNLLDFLGNNKGGDYYYNYFENNNNMWLSADDNTSFSNIEGNYFHNSKLDYQGAYINASYNLFDGSNLKDRALYFSSTFWGGNLNLEYNKIHDYTLSGVHFQNNDYTGDFKGNSIYNVANAITFNGSRTSNDQHDVDSAGSNGLQNYPIISTVNVLNDGSSNDGDMVITGTLNSLANRDYRIDFFATTGAETIVTNPTAEYYLGSVLTSTYGNAAAFYFRYDYDNPTTGAVSQLDLSTGDEITAIAVDISAGAVRYQYNSSIISDAFIYNLVQHQVAILPSNIVFKVSNSADTDDGNYSLGNLTLREAVALSNSKSNTSHVSYISDYFFDTDDIIEIDISGTVTLSSTLTITDKVTIQNGTNGYTAPGLLVDPGTPNNPSEVGNTGGVYGASITGLGDVPFRISGQTVLFNAGSDGSVFDGLGRLSGFININVDDVIIKNSYFSGTTGTAISILSDASNIEIINNYFTGFSNHINVTSSGLNISFEHNIFRNSTNNSSLSFSSIILGTLSNQVNIIYNDSYSNGGAGIYAQGTNHVIRGNKIHNNNAYGIAASTATGVTIYENEIYSNAGSPGVGIAAGPNSVVTYNKIYNNDQGITSAEVTGYIGANSIFNNTNTSNGGINTDSVSNDLNDIDTNMQNTPIISSVTVIQGAVSGNGNVIIQGSLNSQTNKNYRIEFYANTGFEASNSQAENYLGYLESSTLGNDLTFSFLYDYDNSLNGAVSMVDVISTDTISAIAYDITTAPNQYNYLTSEIYVFNQSLPTASNPPIVVAPTIDYQGDSTFGYITNQNLPIIVGNYTQDVNATILLQIYKITDNLGNKTLVHTASNFDIVRNPGMGTWRYDLAGKIVGLDPGIYDLEISINDHYNAAMYISELSHTVNGEFDKLIVTGADSNSLGLVKTTQYEQSSNTNISGEVNNSSSIVLTVIDFGTGPQISIANVSGSSWSSNFDNILPSDGDFDVNVHAYNGSDYDYGQFSGAYVVDSLHPTVNMDNVNGLETAPELTGTFTDTNDVTAIIVSIAPTGSLDINNLNPNNTFVIGSDPHNVLNPSLQSVTGSINTASNTWTINSGQISSLSPGISYDVVVMGLDPAGNLTSLSSGSILSGAIIITQNLDASLNDFLQQLISILGDDGLVVTGSGDSSLTGTASYDVIGNSTDDVVNAALRAASDAQNAANSALQHAQAAQAQAAANPEYQDSANAAQQAAQASQAAADASQAQANQAQAAQVSGDSAAAQQASASAQAASSVAQSAAQAAEQAAAGGDSSSDGGIAGALSGFAQAFSNIAMGAAGSAGAVANIVFDISWNTMLNQPVTSAAAAAAGFTLTLAVISGGQVVSVVFTTGGFGSGAMAALQNATGSIFQNMGANMLRLGGTPTMTTANKAGADVGSHMVDSSMQTQDFNQEQDVELSEDTECILNRYINTLGRKVSNEGLGVINRE